MEKMKFETDSMTERNIDKIAGLFPNCIMKKTNKVREAKTIAKSQPFRDSSFANSPSKINVGEIFKLLAPDTRVKVI